MPLSIRLALSTALGVFLFTPTAHAAPLYQIQQLGLTAPINEYANGQGANSYAVAMNSSGQVIGQSDIYDNQGFGIQMGQDAWIYTGGQTIQLGYTGAGYEGPSLSHPGLGDFRQTFVFAINNSGLAIGDSTNVDSSGNIYGAQGWLYNSATSSYTNLGFTGGIYQFVDPSTGDVNSSSGAFMINDNGQALGGSGTYSPDGSITGNDSWIYDANTNTTTKVGLYGAAYYTAGTTISQNNALQLNSAGQAIGFTSLATTDGSYAGGDAWFYNPISKTTQQIGLIGPDYQTPNSGAIGGFTRYSNPNVLNNTGEVAGSTQRYSLAGTPFGLDSWIYSSSTNSTIQIGLIGPGYQYTIPGAGIFRASTPQFLSDNGFAIGNSERFNSLGFILGFDTWAYNPNTNSTTLIGLTGGIYETPSNMPGGGNMRFSDTFLINNNGQAAGTSSIFNSAGISTGQDAWIYDGTSTRQIGLIGGIYQAFSPTDPAFGGGFQRTSQLQQIAQNGDVIGTSDTYDPDGSQAGDDAWFYSGVTQTTYLMGPTDSLHEFSLSDGTLGRSATVVQLNENHQVIGYTLRFDSNDNTIGNDGWFFDATTDVTTLINSGSVDPDNGYSNTIPFILSNSGVVLGEYELFSGDTDLGTHLFWWDQGSFADLGALAGGAPDWSLLESIYGDQTPGTIGDMPQFILGTGLVNGQGGGQSVFLMTAVPEPTLFAPIAFGAFC